MSLPESTNPREKCTKAVTVLVNIIDGGHFTTLEVTVCSVLVLQASPLNFCSTDRFQYPAYGKVIVMRRRTTSRKSTLKLQISQLLTGACIIIVFLSHDNAWLTFIECSLLLPLMGLDGSRSTSFSGDPIKKEVGATHKAIRVAAMCTEDR